MYPTGLLYMVLKCILFFLCISKYESYCPQRPEILLNFLELKLPMTVRHQVRVLRTKLGPLQKGYAVLTTEQSLWTL